MNDQSSLLRDALGAIERLQAQLEVSEGRRTEPIAIIGAGCRYSGGVRDPESLWRLVHDRVNAVIPVPSDRWDVPAFVDATPGTRGKMYSARGGFLEDIDKFDAQFFGITPREAQNIDPQQRLLLETSYEALESAGIAVESLAGSRTGVFAGATSTDYGFLLDQVPVGQGDIYSINGRGLHAAAGRISFSFGLLGPCVAVDTACSTSLVAVHLACQSLRSGESDLALAGGANVILGPGGMILFAENGLMALNGACKTFDADADGFVRSEGCAVVALKRLSDAQRDGDPILAVVRGAAVNSDGRSAGLTQPYGPAQEAVVRSALANGALAPTDVDYVEAHGTGTPTGDPIEVEALANVLGVGRSPDQPLILGSVKTNIGHPEAAAGLAGLLKVAMALKHEEIPANLHFSTPNPRIAWDLHPVRVASEPIPWRKRGHPRRGGVSSFGFSGTNAHVIIEEAPALPERAPSPPHPVLVPLSARGPQALADLALRHADNLAEHPEINLDDLAYTLGAGRDHMSNRVALVVDTAADLERNLRSIAAGDLPAGAAQFTARGERPRIAFLFTGQGAQYAGMGRGLYDSEPVFRAVIDQAAAVLDPLLERPLLDVLFAAEGDAELINATGYTQPALFALEYALAELWRSWGVTPSVVLGHSVGEFAAACVAGVFSFTDGLKLITERGRLMQALPAGGGMAAVFAAEPRVSALINARSDRLSLAAINGPEETVISGDKAALAEVLAELASQGVDSRQLEVSHGFHSPLLEPMLDALEKRAAEIPHAAPQMLLISNLTGAPFAHGAGPDASYWRRHARSPVRFAASIKSLEDAGVDILVEIGPSPTLLGLAGRAAPQADWSSVASMRRGRDERREILAAARDIHVRGAVLDWRALPSGRMGRRIALPTYPFQRVRHWVPEFKAKPVRDKSGHNLLGDRQPGPGPAISFLSELTVDHPAFLADHVVHGTTIVPAAGFVEMMLAAGRAVGIKGAITLDRVVLEQSLELDGDDVRLVHTTLTPDQSGGYEVVIRSATLEEGSGEQEWLDHVRARLRRGAGKGANAAPTAALLKDQPSVELDLPHLYSTYAERGLMFGPAFKTLMGVNATERGSLGQLELRPSVKDTTYNIHPVMLDGGLQLAGTFVYAQNGTSLDTQPKDETYVPISIDELVLYRQSADRMLATAHLVEATSDMRTLRADVRFETEAGELVATVTGLVERSVSSESVTRRSRRIAAHSLVRQWAPVALPDEKRPVAGGRYVIIADAAGFSAKLGEAIAAQGGASSILDWSAVGADGLKAALNAGHGEPPRMLIDCAALDEAAEDQDPIAAMERQYLRLLDVAKTTAEVAPHTALCLLTRGAQAVAPGDEVVLAQAALGGLVRTLAAEQTLAARLGIDLDPSVPPDPRAVLAALGTLSAEEAEVAVRHGAVLAPRLDKFKPSTWDPTEPTRSVLTINERGDLDRLVFEEVSRVAPGPGQVEIEVRASGLNFRDIINALGMYPAPVPPLGSECAGVVSAVGAGVTDLKVGDEVVAIAPESFASHCTCNAVMAVRKPASISFAEAVTIPNAYLTAQLCLNVGGLKPGQRVLVHAAAGGVGSAAVRLARLAGLEVFATAGNPEKRAFVKARGATHVFDSRSTAFAEQILQVTNGEGVDLVINSLAGEFISAGMRIVRPGGSFVEIGKQGIWTQEEAAQRAPGVRYHVEDLGWNIAHAPEAVRVDFDQIMELAEEGQIDPLPLRVFPLSGAKEAFRHMANARHIGKVVLAPDAWAPPLDIRADGTYLVTGGLGGIGLKVVQWLIERGAGHVVIASRRGASGHEGLLEQLGSGDTRVTAVACDVGDRAAVEALWRDRLKSLPPLRGIIHGAGVLADAPVEDQDEARFHTVRRPKADGAWNLHEVSARDPLDFFLMFSSTSALFGSPGQANYATANAYLDGLAAYRRLRGQTAVSIAWGPWAEVGMASHLEAQHGVWARGGVGLIDPAKGVAAMESILSSPAPYVAVTALNLRLVANQGSLAMRALLRNERGGAGQAAASEGAASGGGQALGAFKAAQDPAERRALLQAYVHEQVARVLGFTPSSLDPQSSLAEVGLNSLMAVQLRNTVTSNLGVDLPVKALLQSRSVLDLVEVIAGLLPSAPAEPEPGEAEAWEEGTL